MKRTDIKKYIATLLLASLFTGCSDILNETPRGIYTPEYFKTEKGVIGGITSLYGNLRYVYGNGYWLIACEAGTDEYTYGSLGDNNSKDMDLSGAGSLNPSSSRSDVLWGRAYSDINTASGIIENGAQIETISKALIAEARFFRAFDYFTLVQTFGGVPLDLGAGELKFNTSTSRTSVRNTVPEVYTKAVFPDLLTAITDLPDNGRVTGGVTKTLARLYLAKAYLTYGWWLENPKNIPTYPETPRTDPDGHNAQWYYQEAYNIATAAIANPGPFGLQQTYYDVNLAQNDRNKEMLLYADHTESSEYYDGEQSHSYNTGGSPGNFAVWMATWDYTGLESATTADWAGAKIRSVQREAAQAYGRPWTRIAPTIDVVTKTFTDKAIDSRYDGTFVTSFRANWNKAGVKNEVLYNANGMPVYPGDAILTILDEEPTTPIDYSNSVYKSNVGAGVLPGRSDFVIAPSGISRYAFPNLWKLGTYRTDNGTGLGQPNGSITRPFPIAKFSELYLVAAEAAVKGATTTAGQSARELVNVLRARAGKWNWSNNGNMAKVQDNSAAMIAATPATITIDYILAERSREFFGEGYRWWDLVRTQKWSELASTFEICGTTPGDHTPKKGTRNIQPYLYLRPIPTGQIDGMEMSAADKAAYQNPGY
ncbi:RagB/SusD family nutrient uptake outer membrane protein [Dysgonomonas sp. HGC4]|uniref:RagB/SusD family nutrient uptake outer membrane protein n=1 Tax=Dysgonomonas sp. HGC4 TaxID=1658009 RepID=UPI000681CF45|nr:RagB/SusD family nutrient uptake outer membrane protein [Dysgonomonas sp. HGC4]MBD8347605.1 RagB/SusD family nutrient uptake outer membrane protein [Dysgonomonas sp. HGC4]